MTQDDFRRGASSLAVLAKMIREDCIFGVPRKDSVRLLFGFADDFRGSGPRGKAALIAQEPPLTGAREFDAALAGLAEFFAGEAGMPAPEWVDEPERFAVPWFFVPVDPDLSAYVLARTPIVFKRHGVYLAREVFDRA